MKSNGFRYISSTISIDKAKRLALRSGNNNLIELLKQNGASLETKQNFSMLLTQKKSIFKAIRKNDLRKLKKEIDKNLNFTLRNDTPLYILIIIF